MSDFIFSGVRKSEGELKKALAAVCPEDTTQTLEFHGRWGSLAIKRNHYTGLDPVETDSSLVAVVGGPILTFASNGFLTGEDPTAGTRLIAGRRQSLTGVDWSTDLSGPFALLALDKTTGHLQVVTDLMSFIPVFHTTGVNGLLVGTHIDALASLSGRGNPKDPVSLADFILHGYITWPYTAYTGVRQLAAASIHEWLPGEKSPGRSEPYWQPLEHDPFRDIDEAADALRKTLGEYIGSVTECMDHVGQFLSGGEDSRAILALLPKRCRRDAMIFLDSFNREGRIAKRASEAYGARFRLFERSQTRYLDVLPQCSDLVGSGSEYTHVHTWGFHKTAELAAYPAVFGGLFSDALLKGSHIRAWKGQRYLPFLPRIGEARFSHDSIALSGLLQSDVLAELERRRRDHFALLRSLRPESAREWYELWPCSMNRISPNLHGNRRLFRSYEPFTSCGVVKISARIPRTWKLNRRLSQRMSKPLFAPSRFLPHAEGWLPYFSWPLNTVLHAVTFPLFTVAELTGLVRGAQGPWCNWKSIMKSDAWQTAVAGALERANFPDGIFTVPVAALFEKKRLPKRSKINLLQVLYQSSGAAGKRVTGASTKPA